MPVFLCVSCIYSLFFVHFCVKIAKCTLQTCTYQILFVPLHPYSVHARDLSLKWEGCGHIEKASYALVLAIRNLVNSTSSKTMQHKMLMVCIFRYTRVVYMYIRRGLRCCCLERKAIPEPRIAEQQDCSPAFIYAYK